MHPVRSKELLGAPTRAGQTAVFADTKCRGGIAVWPQLDDVAKRQRPTEAKPARVGQKSEAILANVSRVPEVGDQWEPIWAEQSGAGYSLLYEVTRASFSIIFIVILQMNQIRLLTPSVYLALANVLNQHLLLVEHAN